MAIAFVMFFKELPKIIDIWVKYFALYHSAIKSVPILEQVGELNSNARFYSYFAEVHVAWNHFIAISWKDVAQVGGTIVWEHGKISGAQMWDNVHTLSGER